jgi:hypothetical protein
MSALSSAMTINSRSSAASRPGNEEGAELGSAVTSIGLHSSGAGLADARLTSYEHNLPVPLQGAFKLGVQGAQNAISSDKLSALFPGDRSGGDR